MNFKTLFSIVILLFITQSHAWVSVGSSPNFGNCSYSTIQEALDSNESEIRVLNNQDFIENLVVNHSVNIKGGFTSCITASLNQVSATNTVIKGSAALGSPVVEIASTNSPTIRFYNLTLKDAVDTIFVDGGHGIDIGTSNGLVEVIDSLIISNSAENGGGIYINDPASAMSLVITNSTIFGNSASIRGGGIYCYGGGVKVRVSGSSVLLENSAEDGGGIAALSGCSVTVDSGSDLSGELRGIIANTASQYGGGAYLNGLGAKLYLEGNKYALNILGNNTSPVTVANNISQNHGGGIYAVNSSTIEITDGYINNNSSSTGRGGGIYLSGSITLLPEVSLQMQSSTTQCWQNGKCSVLANNHAINGGAIHVEKGATATISNTHMYENRADFGTAVYVWDNGESGSIVNLEGNYMYDNGNNGVSPFDDKFVVRVNGDVAVTALHNTIADNDVNDTRAVIGLVNGVDITIKNTIINNGLETVLEDTGSNNTDFYCLIANENTSISAYTWDPGFIDSAANNYHLAGNSQAIDVCIDVMANTLDTDNDARGWDDPDVTNYLSDPTYIFDIGADESYTNDIIYKNDFE